MSKYLLGAAAAALLIVGSSGGAMAATCASLGGESIQGRCHITTETFGDIEPVGSSGNTRREITLVTNSYPIVGNGQVAQGQGVAQFEGEESGGFCWVDHPQQGGEC